MEEHIYLKRLRGCISDCMADDTITANDIVHAVVDELTDTADYHFSQYKKSNGAATLLGDTGTDSLLFKRPFDYLDDCGYDYLVPDTPYLSYPMSSAGTDTISLG